MISKSIKPFLSTISMSIFLTLLTLMANDLHAQDYEIISNIKELLIASEAPSEGLTRAQAEKVINSVKSIYPQFRYSVLWVDQLPANAYNYGGKLILLTKRLVQSVGMTEDVLTLVLLHEIGHSLGGEPKYVNGLSCEDTADRWAASVGLLSVWGMPQGDSEITTFINRARRAIEGIGSILDSLESHSAELLKYKNIIEVNKVFQDFLSKSSECGHHAAALRVYNMLDVFTRR